jgi:Transposase zinc-binding domain
LENGSPAGFCYQKRHGYWRPIIGTVVGKFFNCGDLKHGFARVRCPQCREEFFVAYSCRVRCFCPSCHEKRALEKASWVAEHVCNELPHRQFVFTIPKRLRIYFRFERRLLGELCRAAARTVITVYGAASGRPDAVPGVLSVSCRQSKFLWAKLMAKLRGQFSPLGAFFEPVFAP